MNSGKLSTKTIEISRSTVQDKIAEFLYAIGEVPHSQEIIAMHFGYPKAGEFMSLTNTLEKTVSLTFTSIKEGSNQEVKLIEHE